jgi:SHS2 domain-containing protein
MKYRYLPHTADVSFISYGKTFGEALQNAGTAVLNLMFETREIRKDSGRERVLKVSAIAHTQEDIVWYLLQNAVSAIDSAGLSAYEFHITSLKASKKILSAKCSIMCKATKGYHSRFDVKAVTPSGLEVRNQSGKWTIRAILDV